VSPRSESKEARLHVARWIGSESAQGRRLPDVGAGEIVDEWASPPDADRLRGLAAQAVAARAAMWAPGVRGVIESMNGERFVHDRLGQHGWDVLIADATKVKGLAPFPCKTVRRGADPAAEDRDRGVVLDHPRRRAHALASHG
jgi:hypothetical protein